MSYELSTCAFYRISPTVNRTFKPSSPGQMYWLKYTGCIILIVDHSTQWTFFDACLYRSLCLDDTRQVFEEKTPILLGVKLLPSKRWLYLQSCLFFVDFRLGLQENFTKKLSKSPSHSDLSFLDELEYMLLIIALHPPQVFLSAILWIYGCDLKLSMLRSMLICTFEDGSLLHEHYKFTQ